MLCPVMRIKFRQSGINTSMRIIEILHGLREHEIDFTDPISGTGISVAPGAGSSTALTGAHASGLDLFDPVPETI